MKTSKEFIFTNDELMILNVALYEHIISTKSKINDNMTEKEKERVKYLIRQAEFLQDDFQSAM